MCFFSSHILRRRVWAGRPRRERVASKQVREIAGRHGRRGCVGCAQDKDARKSAEKVSDSVWWTIGLDSSRKDEDDRPFERQEQDPTQEAVESGNVRSE